MRTSSFSVLAFLAAQWVGFGLVACSSSTTTKPRVDAASDTRLPADAPPDAPAASGDARFGDSAFAGDTPGIDTPPSIDLILRDTTAPDGTGGDRWSPADLAAIDARERDVASPDQGSPDSDVDLPKACLADGGYGPPCNDDPNSAAVMGACQADGTCKCNSGYVLNPSTGRCRYPPRDASVAPDALANLCTGAYDSCQCSCCGNIGRGMKCYYPTLGESVAALAAADQEKWASVVCGGDVCSSGTHYLCCTPAEPESPSAATYTTTAYVGGIDRLGIVKTGADCATLSFAGGSSGKPELRIDTNAYWIAEGASFGPCGDAGSRTVAQGALGTLSFRDVEGVCVMDLHATLFAISDAAELTTARMDAEGIPMPSMLGGCWWLDP